MGLPLHSHSSRVPIQACLQGPMPQFRVLVQGKQHAESHEVPDPGSVSDPWEVPLRTTMPHEILWSYIAFHAVSVSSFVLVHFSPYITPQHVYAPSLRSLQCCVSWEHSLQLSLFQLQHRMSRIMEHPQQDCTRQVELCKVSNELRVEGHFEGLWKKLEFPTTLELFPLAQLALNVQSCGSGP